MATHSLRDLLNRARWRDGELHSLEISLLHRGAPGDQRVVGGSRIIAVRGAGIELTPDSAEGESLFVPYHRFLSIRGPEGVVVWDKTGGTSARAESVSSAATSKPAAEQRVEHDAKDVGGTEVLSTLRVVLREATKDAPIVIDGSAGEGGGQILRTSLALSMLTGTPFVLERVRAGRRKPGLMRQHLTCVKAAAAICGAELEGAALGSSRLVFRPGVIRGGDFDLDIGSAGSVSLVLQTIALPLALAGAPSVVRVRGGTHALWAPPHPFLESAWLPLVQRAGADVSLELVSPGFYPAGGGEVVMTTRPVDALSPLHLVASTGELALSARAIVSGISEGIARRELSAAAEALSGEKLTLSSASVRSPGPGNAIWLSAHDQVTGVTNVFSAIGEVDVRAEEVGRAVAASFLAWRRAGASIESHLADQVLLPIALAGEGSFTCDALTLHTTTNLEVIRAFTGHRFRAWDLGGSRFRVSLAG
jgi:RNA 3'-terminal phosphate cyclase (ATP)